MYESASSFGGVQNMPEVMNLAKLLRNNGDKVLSSESKLSLSLSLLSDINESFSLIVYENEDLESSFQVCNSSRNEIFRDIKFLHDFVQKTVGLKLTNDQNIPNALCDIAKFRHLKFLELHKIPVILIKGIQTIRSQLECVICTGGKSVCKLNHLLESCGADGSVGFIWTSLHRLALTYNDLIFLDNSLEYVPWLQTLDLSHNHLKSAAELELLPNLKNVNLGYNHLEKVPLFHKSASQSLQKLILKNNYIDDISNLSDLQNLVELDLSYNCIMDHYCLWPLEMMSVLLWISLEGNPLYYHPRHRLHTTKHLHPSLSDSKFILDGLVLNKSEKLFVSENRVYFLPPARIRQKNDTSALGNALMSERSFSSAEAIEKHSESFDTKNVLPDDIVVVTKTKKKKNVKEAVIGEDEFEKETKAESSPRKTYVEPLSDHLELKNQILALREKFGESNWLSSQGGAHVQSIMGIENLAYDYSSEDLVNKFSPNSDFTKLSKTLEKSKESDQQNNPQEEQTDEEVEISIGKNNGSFSENFQKFVKEPAAPYDPEAEAGDLYLVQKIKKDHEIEEIFLILTPEDIKERDSITGNIKYRWSTKTVLSCVMGRNDPVTVDIVFDTTRRDRESRTYIIDNNHDAKKIVETLSECIKLRPMSLKVFKCMKCSTHFSQDDENSVVSSVANCSGPPQCPMCKSTLVIQTDEIKPKELPCKEQKVLSEYAEESKELSGSQSSIGAGRTEGGSVNVATSLVHSDSNPQVRKIHCSAASLEESRESTPTAATVGNKKYESDIEILSNPSQSSIEVLDDVSNRPTSTPMQNTSIEDKHNVISSLLTSQDPNIIMLGLTESSSSGSLTDSVCTAYENKTVKSLIDKSTVTQSRNAHEVPAVKEENTDVGTAFTPVVNLTSMLGGILQSMKIGQSKDAAFESEDNVNFLGNGVQYSFTDFRNVDHRIKLHLILNIFEHENEELALFLRADILTRSSVYTFPGCLVLSTAKVYILRIIGAEGENPEKWLQIETSWTIDRLRIFAPLPFKQGVLVELDKPNASSETSDNNVFLCILQDFQRTSNFLYYLTDSPLPSCCELEFTVPSYCNILMKTSLKTSKNYNEDEVIRLLALFTSAEIKVSNQGFNLKCSSIIVTASALFIFEDNNHWLLPGSKQVPSIVTEQCMSNLIEVDFCGKTLNLQFLDEVAGVEVNWILNFVSKSAAETVINSIRPPWEELFSVPLQVNLSSMDAITT